MISEELKKKKIAIFYDVVTGRDDGPPLYYRRNLVKMGFDVTFLAPKDHESIEAFGDFDLYLWVDWGEDALKDILTYIPVDMSRYHPSVYITSDTHLGFDYRVNKAKEFDYVFCNQKRAVEEFKKEKVEAEWLLHAVDLDIYSDEPKSIKKYDVGFVGFVSNKKRAEALDTIFKENPNFWYGQRFFEEAAMKYKECRVNFNNAAVDDINMRFFEVLGCGGGVLVTEDVPTLEEIMPAEATCIRYNPNDWVQAVDQIQRTLSFPLLIEESARNGRKWVEENHTYEHRIKEALIPILEKDNG